MRAISILLNDLRMMLKEPFAFTVLLVLPVALMGPALLNYQSGGGETLDATPLVVANYDTGQVSLDLIKELEGSLKIEQNISGLFEDRASKRVNATGRLCSHATTKFVESTSVCALLNKCTLKRLGRLAAKRVHIANLKCTSSRLPSNSTPCR